MEKNQLWTLLRTFTKRELRDGRQFLDLQAVNRRDDVRTLYDALAASLVRELPPERKTVYALVFPNATSYDDQAFRLVQSYLYKCLERFLVWRECEATADIADPLLLRAYRRRGLDRHLQRTLRRQATADRRRPIANAETLIARHLRERERATQLARGGRAQELNLQTVEDSLDHAFWAYKLRQACFTRSHESVFDTRYAPRHLDAILQAAATDETPAVAVYHAGYTALFGAPSDTAFERFQSLLQTHAARFPAAEARSLYLLALNYCIRRINANDDPYRRAAFDLYRTGIASGALLEQGIISRFTFANVVGIALRLGELDWTAAFVNDYAAALSDAHRVPTVAFTRARLAFARCAFNEVLTHLQSADTKDPINAMNARILQLKVYHETAERELFGHHLRTTRQFVRRHARSYHHELWRNILRYMKQLHRLNPHDRAERDALRAAIMAEPQLMERAWLLEALENS